MRSSFRRIRAAVPLSLAALSLALPLPAHAASKKKAPAHHGHEVHAPRRHVEGAVETAPKAAKVEAPAPAETMATRGPARLDFDDRLVQGQSNKAGAIFLYDRKNLPLRSMVRTRTSFRDQIEDELPAEEP